MKRLLYFLTMIFNITGIIFCVGMMFILKSASFVYLPLVLLSIAIFTFSFGITFLDFNNRICKTKNKYVFQKPKITDYREFFSQRRSEFLI